MLLNPEIQLIRPFSYPHLIDEETEIQGVQQLAQHHTAWEDQTGILIQAVWLNRILLIVKELQIKISIKISFFHLPN